MRVRPYPTEVQEEAMRRLRAGETFKAVQKSLHADDQRLRLDLRKYPDFKPLMDANSRKGNTDRPKRRKSWVFPNDKRGPVKDAPLALSDNQIAALKGRRIKDKNELELIHAKLVGWLSHPAILVPSSKEPSVVYE